MSVVVILVVLFVYLRLYYYLLPMGFDDEVAALLNYDIVYSIVLLDSC